MERLWSPWRMTYVASADKTNAGGCIFCEHLEAVDDTEAHVLYRARSMFVLLNAFPYNTGHLMVAPTRHVADIGDLDVEERVELMEVTHIATAALRKAMAPDGFNIGMNLGSAGGAGIPGHLHMHVVPRWTGDTNFMTTIGASKVLPEMLADTDAKLRELFPT
jgi:ATP adenylyltransferase